MSDVTRILNAIDGGDTNWQEAAVTRSTQRVVPPLNGSGIRSPVKLDNAHRIDIIEGCTVMTALLQNKHMDRNMKSGSYQDGVRFLVDTSRGG